MNIIKVIEFDFNIESFYKDLYHMTSPGINEPRDQSAVKNNVARAILLDLIKTGGSLFYDSFHLSLSAVVLANYFLTG